MIDLRKRTYAAEAKKRESRSVTVAGWVKSVRLLGKLAFVIMRDRSGTIQLTFKPGVESYEALKTLTPESVLAATGDVIRGKVKSGENELVVKEWEILSRSETPLPIDVWGNTPTALDKRLDYRFMDLRAEKIRAIFEVRSFVNRVIREVLLGKNFIEIQTPKIAGAGAEGGAELFKFSYYDRDAYLSQSQQLYKQMLMASGFDGVFEIGPSFRAEKSHTKRHLAEFTQLDFEVAFVDSEEDVLGSLEDIFVEVLKRVKSECGAACSLLNAKVIVPKKPFPRIKHREAVRLLQEAGSSISDGEDIGSEDERKLGEIVKKAYGADAYFITEFPYGLKPFYITKKPGGVSSGFDFEYLGEEVASGGQREHRYEVLVEQIKEKGLNPEQFSFYLTPFRYGMPPHGGFGLGVDRLVKLILGLEDVKEAVLFPRTPERLVP